MEVRGVPKAQRRAAAERLIREVGLGGFEQHYRHELSGGMRQRANIIRTLSYEPELILMDEPFGPLDAQTRLQLQGQLLDLWQRRPGRVKQVFEVDIPRPRDIYRLQTLDSFHRLYEQVWHILEDEMREAAEV